MEPLTLHWVMCLALANVSESGTWHLEQGVVTLHEGLPFPINFLPLLLESYVSRHERPLTVQCGGGLRPSDNSHLLWLSVPLLANTLMFPAKNYMKEVNLPWFCMINSILAWRFCLENFLFPDSAQQRGMYIRLSHMSANELPGNRK